MGGNHAATYPHPGSLVLFLSFLSAGAYGGGRVGVLCLFCYETLMGDPWPVSLPIQSLMPVA